MPCVRYFNVEIYRNTSCFSVQSRAVVGSILLTGSNECLSTQINEWKAM